MSDAIVRKWVPAYKEASINVPIVIPDDIVQKVDDYVVI